VVTGGGSSQVAKLHFGDPLTGRHTMAGLFLLGSHAGTQPFDIGQFVPLHGYSQRLSHPIIGYVAFKENVGGLNYYGWLRVQVAYAYVIPRIISLVPMPGTTDIYGAYGLASTGITAGEYSTSASAIPEPANVASGLALFALGAVGVREYRRRRQAAA
jgi:hypothetical protein